MFLVLPRRRKWNSGTNKVMNLCSVRYIGGRRMITELVNFRYETFLFIYNSGH